MLFYFLEHCRKMQKTKLEKQTLSLPIDVKKETQHALAISVQALNAKNLSEITFDLGNC